MKQHSSILSLIIYSLYVFGITPVILHSEGFFKGQQWVIGAFWVTAATSAVVLLLTLTRWVKKYPTPLTWLSAAAGVVSVVTLIYSVTSLDVIYGAPFGHVRSLPAILMLLLTVGALLLIPKAMKSKFKN